jgi:hypothetical protein
MQLGTRWNVGDNAPATLPEVVLLAVKTVEDDLVTLGTDTAAWKWTLTWLERKPVVELDDGTVLRYDDREDAATITLPADAVEDPFDDED